MTKPVSIRLKLDKYGVLGPLMRDSARDVQVIAILLTLFLLVRAPRAEAQVRADVAAGLPVAALPFDRVASGGGCPRRCAEWFDGCNVCTCESGRMAACTRKFCEQPGRARCLRYRF